MRKRFTVFFTVFMVLFGALNYYIGLRGWQWLRTVLPLEGRAWVYWVPFWLLALSFPLSRFASRRLPRRAVRPLAIVGAYWLPFFMYALMLLVLVDLGRLLAGLAGMAPAPPALGGVVLAVPIGLLLYGAWRARTPAVVRYEIAIPKRGGNHRELHAVLVSDTHSGTINGNRRLQAMVTMVNALEPDLLLLAGDLMDDDFQAFAAAKMADELKALRSRLGVYAVLGNHDYGAGNLAAYRQLLHRANVHLLVDDWVKVDDSFYVIGRDEISGSAYTGGPPRKPLEEVLLGVDRSLPLILMDHQPARLGEAAAAGIDLQVSGHTHRGQMFPYQYITRRVFEIDWGYLRKGALHVVVSLGFGTWGPPIRIGNRPEVVSIRIKFTEG